MRNIAKKSLALYGLFAIAALHPTLPHCQAVNNISVSTSGLLTGSRERKCPADTWILSAQPGQRIELIVRDYTSRGGAASPTHNDPAAAAAAADAVDYHGDYDDNENEDEVATDGKSRSDICTNLVYILSDFAAT